MDFKPTKAQQAVRDELRNGSGHIVVKAVAGAGKSTTLKMLTNDIPTFNKSASCCFLAFNRTIKEEMQKKLPAFVDVSTSHSMGYRVLRQNLRVGQVDEDKYKILVNEAVNSRFFEEDENPQKWGKRVFDLIDLGRMALANTPAKMAKVADRYDIDAFEDEIPTALKIINKGRERLESIDYTDMIYLPNVITGVPRIDCNGNKSFHALSFPQFDFVFVDEAQDFNILQQKIVRKLLKPGGRFVAVGDDFQCIYSFMGADSESFSRFQRFPNTTKIDLDVCFRCPKSVIKVVQTIAPHIRAFENNIEGEVVGLSDGKKISVEDAQPGDLILCARNAPLVKACYRLLAQQKKAYIRGKNFGEGLVNLVKKCRSNDLKDVKTYLNKYLEKYQQRLAKAKPNLSRTQILESNLYESQVDKTDIIHHLIIENGTVKDKASLIAKIRSLFKDAATEGVTLSTVHKAKGDEADNVFILHYSDFTGVGKKEKQAWEIEQMRNLHYVALTRPKKALYFVDEADDEEQIEPSARGGGEAKDLRFETPESDL